MRYVHQNCETLKRGRKVKRGRGSEGEKCITGCEMVETGRTERIGIDKYRAAARLARRAGQGRRAEPPPEGVPRPSAAVSLVD